MKQVYVNALMLLDDRIKQCGQLLRASTDEHSLSHWAQELNNAQVSHKKILNRSKIYANVVHVDFINKKKAS